MTNDFLALVIGFVLGVLVCHAGII